MKTRQEFISIIITLADNTNSIEEKDYVHSLLINEDLLMIDEDEKEFYNFTDINLLYNAYVQYYHLNTAYKETFNMLNKHGYNKDSLHDEYIAKLVEINVNYGMNKIFCMIDKA